ncbi:MAG: FG-GAP repeat protein, partial [Thermoplasmata archaeon]|nr:FG-GAP repeat protein [Thermoplasmata archaeon]
MQSHSNLNNIRSLRIIIILCILLLANFGVVFANNSAIDDAVQPSSNPAPSQPESLPLAVRNDGSPEMPTEDVIDTATSARAGRARAMSIDLLTDQELVILGNDTSDLTYGAIATGDVNGDWIDDIIIGANLAGEGINRSMGGEIYVILGDPTINAQDYINLNITNNTFTTAHHDVLIYGPEKEDYAGTAVAVADFNGDALDDIIIGAKGADGPSNTRPTCGEVHIVYGRFNFPNIIDLNTTNANFEHGDHVIYGVDPYDEMGDEIVTGNVDGDNYEDICIGVNLGYGKDNNKPLAGETIVVYGDTTLNLGDTTDLNTSQYYLTIYGNDSFDRSGFSVCLADIDNDGKDDIIIGAPESSGYNNNFTSPGECYILYGDTRADLNQTGTNKMEWDLNVQPANVTFYGLNSTETFASSLVCGDIDNDSYPDLLIGVVDGDGPNGSGRVNTGKVYLYYGRPRSAEYTTIVNATFENVTVIHGAEANDRVGGSLVIADLDLDGHGDIIIGATAGDGSNNFRYDAGEVYIIFGSNRTNIGGIIDLDINDDTYSTKHHDKIIYGKRFNDGLGEKLIVADVDDDGLPDMLLLAPGGDGYQNKPVNVGNVHVLFGKPTIIIENITLINGDGPNRNTCYAKYDNYTFQVNITANKFRTDLEKVKVILAPKSFFELEFYWNRSSDKFSSGNYSYAYLTNESYSQWINGKNLWSLYMKVIFNWSYQYESLTHCYVYSYKYDNAEFFDSFQYIFKVENDLNFYGNFSIVGEFQGQLEYGDWVRGEEQITWGNQKVVYGN